MTDNLKEATHISSHPALIKAVLQSIKELGYLYEKNRISSIGTKTGTVLINFTSDFDKSLHSIRIQKTLQYIRKKDINTIVTAIILELDEPIVETNKVYSNIDDIL